MIRLRYPRAPLVLAAMLASFPAPPARGQTSPRPLRPAHTFSIVAMDSATGEIGGAVQSHWFSVGSSVVWAEPGVGAVATQSFIEPAYGPRGLALMRTGVPAPLVLRALVAADPDSAVRQLGMIDAQGRVASYTGRRDVPEAGSHVGRWYAAQANLMARNTVWDAMARAFETTSGDRRLPPWQRIFDLRVEDSHEPIRELRRLVHVERAYNLATDGDNYTTAGKVDSAIVAYASAEALLPDSAVNGELVFWHASTLADRGRVDEADPALRARLRPGHRVGDAAMATAEGGAAQRGLQHHRADHSRSECTQEMSVQ